MQYGPYIVLEGPDGVGKTTLANEIASDTHWPIVHCGPPEKLAWKEWIGKTLVEGPAIFDRLHVGSIAYAGAFRSMFDVYDHENWLVEGWLMSRGCTLIWCNVSSQVQEKNLGEGDRGENAMYEAADKRRQVRTLYSDYFGNVLHVRSHIKPWVYDYTVQGRDLMVNTAIMEVETREGLIPEPPCLGNTVNPRIVFVGDRQHGLTKTQKHMKEYSFGQAYLDRVRRKVGPEQVATFGGVSGRYLHMCLTMSGLKMDEYCIFNSQNWTWKDPFEDPNIRRIIKNAERVVALGREAELAVARAHIGRSYEMIPHPQFWKRFKYKYQHVYADMLRGDSRELVREGSSSRLFVPVSSSRGDGGLRV